MDDTQPQHGLIAAQVVVFWDPGCVGTVHLVDGAHAAPHTVTWCARRIADSDAVILPMLEHRHDQRPWAGKLSLNSSDICSPCWHAYHGAESKVYLWRTLVRIHKTEDRGAWIFLPGVDFWTTFLVPWARLAGVQLDPFDDEPTEWDRIQAIDKVRAHFREYKRTHAMINTGADHRADFRFEDWGC